MSEPTGASIDGTPWEEPRPPHLPDRLTRVPLLVWPFVALAALQLIWTWMEYRQLFAGDPVATLPMALTAVIRTSPILVGAALFIRHPDALVTLPLLVLGATLLALEQVLLLLQLPLLPVLESVWPPSADTFDSAAALFIATLPSTIYGLIAFLAGAAAIWFLARGLQRARRRGDDWSRILFIALAAVAGLATILRIGAYMQPVDASLGALGPVVIGVNAVVGLASMLVTSYFLVVVFAGWRAGERPSIGWALAAVSAALGLLVSGTLAVASASPSDVPTDGSGILLGATTLTIAAAPLALLAAFVLGLPATDPEITPDPPEVTTPGSAGS